MINLKSVQFSYDKALRIFDQIPDQELPGVLLEQWTWWNLPGFAYVRTHQLYLCFLTPLPLDSTTKHYLQEYFVKTGQAQLVRSWSTDQSTQFVDALSETPLDFSLTDVKIPQPMSPWEWTSFGASILQRQLDKAKLEVFRVDTNPILPHLWFTDGVKAKAVLILSYPSLGLSQDVHFQEEQLQWLVKETDGRNPFDILCAHVRFYDESQEKYDPLNPQLAQRKPLRRSPLKLIDPEKILSQKMELGHFIPGQKLQLKKLNLNS